MKFDFKKECKGVISIIGASEIDKTTENLTFELGRLLAKNNYAISCGGLSGVMEVICKGAKEENGFTIGIIPHKDKTKANKYIDVVIPVPFSQARNIVVVLSGDLCVAISGKAGTLSEICFAWIYQKPIIALSSTKGWSSKIANTRLDDRRTDKIHEAKTPLDVIRLIEELLKSEKIKKARFTDSF